MVEKFCPNCKSTNVFVFAVGWKCGDCGYYALQFPEMETEKTESLEDNKKDEENETKGE